MSNIKTQYLLSLQLIQNCNTIKTGSPNQRLRKWKFDQISINVSGQMYRENIYKGHNQSYCWNIQNYLLNMIHSIIQNIENSIMFSQLAKMHPSIMKINDFFKNSNFR